MKIVVVFLVVAVSSCSGQLGSITGVPAGGDLLPVEEAPTVSSPLEICMITALKESQEHLLRLSLLICTYEKGVETRNDDNWKSVRQSLIDILEDLGCSLETSLGTDEVETQNDDNLKSGDQSLNVNLETRNVDNWKSVRQSLIDILEDLGCYLNAALGTDEVETQNDDNWKSGDQSLNVNLETQNDDNWKSGDQSLIEMLEKLVCYLNAALGTDEVETRNDDNWKSVDPSLKVNLETRNDDDWKSVRQSLIEILEDLGCFLETSLGTNEVETQNDDNWKSGEQLLKVNLETQNDDDWKSVRQLLIEILEDLGCYLNAALGTDEVEDTTSTTSHVTIKLLKTLRPVLDKSGLSELAFVTSCQLTEKFLEPTCLPLLLGGDVPLLLTDLATQACPGINKKVAYDDLLSIVKRTSCLLTDAPLDLDEVVNNITQKNDVGDLIFSGSAGPIGDLIVNVLCVDAKILLPDLFI